MRHMVNIYPALRNLDTYAGLAQAMDGWTPPAHLQQPIMERTDVRIKDEQRTINEILRRVARKILGARRQDDQEFSQTMAQLWTEVKSGMQIPSSVHFGDIQDLGKLASIKKYVLVLEQRR